MDTWDFPLDIATLERLTTEVLGSFTALTPLSGDASTRRFFRVSRPGGPSLVAMVLEGPFDPAVHPQILVGRYFQTLALPVPALEQSLPQAGLLFYEDLGDDLLQDLAGEVFDRPDVTAPREARPTPSRDAAPARARVASLYHDAVAMLAVLQGRGTRELPPDHPSARVALDEDRFLFELRFFREHYVEGFRNLALGPRESAALDAFLASLAKAASAPPRVLCHRDYHSRNLLVQSSRLRLVDFQDARLGPVAYDLASLLRDSYVELPTELREELMTKFLEDNASRIPSADEFRGQFEIVALQRNLKAIGTFAFQATTRGKDHYLPYIPPTWHDALGALERAPLSKSDARPILEMLASA